MNIEAILEHIGKGVSPSKLKIAYETISKSYRSKTPIKLNTVELCLAYMMIRMPATIAVIEKIQQHLAPYQEELESLLDLGSGPGSFLWSSQSLKLQKATLIDQQLELMKLGQEVQKQADIEIDIQWVQKKLPQADLNVQNHDIVSLSYVLNELIASQQRQLIEQAWSYTNRFLVVIEPGTPDGFMNIQTTRRILIEKGGIILAPCTHENDCPMTRQDWCHFTVRFDRSDIHRLTKGKLAYEDEKYSYLIASKNPIPNRPISRIVKRPKRSKGLIEIEVCRAEGLVKQKISKSHGQLYKSASKLVWGDEIN